MSDHMSPRAQLARRLTAIEREHLESAVSRDFIGDPMTAGQYKERYLFAVVDECMRQMDWAYQQGCEREEAIMNDVALGSKETGDELVNKYQAQRTLAPADWKP